MNFEIEYLIYPVSKVVFYQLLLKRSINLKYKTFITVIQFFV